MAQIFVAEAILAWPPLQSLAVKRKFILLIWGSEDTVRKVPR